MKFIKNKLLNVPVTILIISLILRITLFVLNRYGIYLIKQHGIDMLFTIIIVLSAILSLKYIFNDKVIRITFIVLLLFLLVSPLLKGLLFGEVDYTSFSSPDGSVEFQVEETGHGKVFQVGKSGLFKRYKTSYRTNNGYKPFSREAYNLRWKENNILTIEYNISYQMGSGKKEVSLKYDN